MQACGTLFIVSAPSGGGKTSLIDALAQKIPTLKISISYTTRVPRAGEVNGQNYFFVPEDVFSEYQQAGHFLEYAKVFSHWYGTSKKWVEEQLEKGVDVILEIDWQGARRIREQMNCVTIFILPPSKQVLEQRLKGRQQDTLTVIEDRMAQASQEVSHYSEYDYLVVNEDFENALVGLEAIVLSQNLTTPLQKVRYAALLEDLTVG